MIYTFEKFKNVKVSIGIVFLKGFEDNGDTFFQSVGVMRDNETIEQALNRLGIDFDTVYPDYIIQ